MICQLRTVTERWPCPGEACPSAPSAHTQTAEEPAGQAKPEAFLTWAVTSSTSTAPDPFWAMLGELSKEDTFSNKRSSWHIETGLRGFLGKGKKLQINLPAQHTR
jgi:hypothetical protein